MNQFENEIKGGPSHGAQVPRLLNSIPSDRVANQIGGRPTQLRLRFSPLGKNRVHFASRTDEWATPLDLFERLDREFGFTLDPCSTHENAKCPRHFTRAENGLIQDWSREVVFMNPPYGREIGHWMRKALESAEAGATVVCLVPARTDTRWWHDYAIRGNVRFLKGRVKFGSAKASAPFPSAVVVFQKANTQFCLRKES